MSSEGRFGPAGERTEERTEGGASSRSRSRPRRRSRARSDAHEPWAPLGRIDFSRLDVTTRVIGGASLVLFLALEMTWYTTAPTSRTAGFTGSASAMIAGGWRWLLWVGCLSIVGYVFLESVTSFQPPKWLRREETLAAVTGLNLVLVLIGALVDTPLPPLGGARTAAGQSVGTSWGAWIALTAALAASAASLLALKERVPRGASDLLMSETIAYDEPPPELPPHVHVIEPEPVVQSPLLAREIEPEPLVPRRPLHARATETESGALREIFRAAPDLARLKAPVPAHSARAHRVVADPGWLPRPESRESIEVPEPGGDPPSGWMPPQPPPPPPL